MSFIGFASLARPAAEPSLGDPSVERVREANGGQLSPLPFTQTRWYLADLESAIRSADAGYLSRAARLMRAARGDGVVSGLSEVRSKGLVRLPRAFRGAPDQVAALQVGHDSVRSVFDQMCPPAELEALSRDGFELGVGIGELVPVPGRDYPVLVRLDPEFLIYRWSDNRWFYQSVAGLLPIEPGNGRWVMHIPGGVQCPWQSGRWRAVGKAWIRKEHAGLHKDNWEGKLANPARVAVAPQGASEAQKDSWFKRVMAWGVNTVFGLTPGYDVKLLESNGRGHESWEATIERSEREIIIAYAGQMVTTDGGAGFSNANIHEAIRSDLIQGDADALAWTLNTQVIPHFIIARFGEAALQNCAVVSFDTTPPRSRSSDADALLKAAQAVKALTEAYAAVGEQIDAVELAAKFSVPLKAKPSGKPELRVVKTGDAA